MSKADDNYKLLRAQLDERLKADKRLAAIADKIAKGKANFADTAKYTQIVSHHMGKVISENIGKITAPLGKEAVCKELLRDHYDLINGVFGDVQVSVDEKMGIHIKPVKPAYPTERVDTWAHSLEDPTVDQSVIERRGQSGAENIGNSMHDDCVKENAKLHDKAGLDTYLVRDAGGGCCAWCAAIAGRYKYADAPDDVFRRHDHCTCTTTYECGRMRQDVWSKRTWQASDKELEQRKDISEASKPTVNTHEQAKELERQALEKSPVTKLSPEQAQELNERSKPVMHTPAEAKELEDKILGNDAVQNYSKEIDIFDESKLTHQSEITVQDIKDNLQKSKIGQEIAEYSKNLKESIELNDTTIMLDSEGRKIYGKEDGGKITIYLLNCENPERAARTIIHECTHYRYGIGESQWAESVCFAQELKHKYKRDYLTISEKRRIIKAVKEGYPEYNWRKGGRIYGRKQINSR